MKISYLILIEWIDTFNISILFPNIYGTNILVNCPNESSIGTIYFIRLIEV